MSKTVQEWLEEDVEPVRDKPLGWLSQYHFFRDPARPTYSDDSYFFSPADGIILYQTEVHADQPLVQIKGRPYSLRDAMRDPDYARPSLVIGIFMTFYDVHVNRIPYRGRLSYKLLDPIDSCNLPMLEVEHDLLTGLGASLQNAAYLHSNQRMLNRVDSIELGQAYYILQIADYDVDSILPFQLKQNQPCEQGGRFSQIRYGSQVDLIVPLAPRFEYQPTQRTGSHVEAGIDTLIAIRERPSRGSREEPQP